MQAYSHMFDDFMHEVFTFQRRTAQRGCSIEYDIVTYTEAARQAFNLTNPIHSAHDEDNYILLVNFERAFLELTYICMDVQIDCTGHLYKPAIIHELGEKNVKACESPQTEQDELATIQYNATQALSAGITAFLEQTYFDAQKENAVCDSLPFVESWRIKVLDDPAFVFSFGAAAIIRTQLVFQDQLDCYCGHFHDNWKIEHGYPLDHDWPCNRPV
ncbi:hypothetical protein GQ53DRAFT_765082 [Thozetella sp. PMI_491]|nr:hypothetical protein GQ53DRAFT_765082 [Thozetella sp. PMI_491]